MNILRVFIGRTDVEAETPNTLATLFEELTHLKRPWCWERLRAGGEGDNRGWDGWVASLTQWTWVWVDSGSWWWTGRPGELRFMGSQRVRHNWATELNWKKEPRKRKSSILHWQRLLSWGGRIRQGNSALVYEQELGCPQENWSCFLKLEEGGDL